MTEDAMKLQCRGCGSSLEYSAKDQSTKCPYCGTVTEIPKVEEVLPDNPSAILPLTVELTELTDAVYEHLASGDMTPDQLLEHATFTKKERFYTPVWGFRGNYVAEWTASFGYNRREEYTAYERRTENGNTYNVPVTKTRIVTDWRPASGTDTGAFAVLAYAGKQLCDATVDAISLVEKHPDGEVVPFDSSYTTGIPIEPYAASDDDAYSDRAKPQVNEIIEHSVRQHAQGDRQKDWHWTASINKDSFTLLVPICHATYEYQGKAYHVWVGGTNQSRLVADPLPVDLNRKRAVKFGFLPLIVAAIASGFAIFDLGYNAILPVGVFLAAVLYGFLRRSAIIDYSRNVRQSLLANRRAAATNTAAMTEAEQGALRKETERPHQSWLAHTAYDHVVIPLVILMVALTPFGEIVTTAWNHSHEVTSARQEDSPPATNVPPASNASPAQQNITPTVEPPPAESATAPAASTTTTATRTEVSPEILQPEVKEAPRKRAHLSTSPSPHSPNSVAPRGEIRTVSASAPSLSGNWHGEYTNYDKNQTTPVKLQIISENDRTDQLTGTLMFGADGNNSSSCTLTGVYNSQTKFMLLSVGNCQGNAPTNLQGKFGFSSVTLTDVQAFGMDSAHNGLLNISR